MAESPTELRRRLQEYVDATKVASDLRKPPTIRKCEKEIRQAAGLSIIGWWFASYVVRQIIAEMARRLWLRYMAMSVNCAVEENLIGKTDGQ